MSDFVALMRRYVNDYTNRQCLDECDAIMHPDYTLRMGEHVLRGRDDLYKPAAAKQFRQFPGLCLTVNHLFTNGQRLMMQFSEHGASRDHADACAAWGGIGLYRWDGERLRENFVEQDYLSRRSQLSSGQAVAVEHPAVAPWDVKAEPSNPDLERWVRELLAGGGLDVVPAEFFDDAWSGAPTQQVLESDCAQIDDLFSAGDQIAFRLTQSGRVLPDFVGSDHSLIGREAELHMVGWMQVRDGVILRGRVIRDRLGLLRRLRK